MTEKKPGEVRRGRPPKLEVTNISGKEEMAVLTAATKYTGLVMARAILKEYKKLMDKP